MDKLPFLLAALALFAGARAVGYVGGWGVARHRVETAWIWFAIAALLYAVFTAVAAVAGRAAVRDASRSYPSALLLPALVALGVVGYLPVFSSGLLSDDYVLLGWAERGDLLPVEWPFVRVIPLLVWRGTSAVFGAIQTPFALHMISVLLHGVNSYLVARLASAFGASAAAAGAAAMLFVVYPTSVEATAWLSAMPDVAVTTCILGVIVASLAIDDTRVVFAVSIALMLAALATKDNAVVMGPLFLVSAPLVPAPYRRRLLILGATAVALTLLYVAWRVTAGLLPPDVTRPFDRLAVKNFITGPWAFLGLPVHISVLTEQRWLWAVWTAWLAMFLMAAGFIWRRDPWVARVTVWSAVWIAVAVVPTFGFFGVNDDLQSTRYIYLATCAWCITLAIHALPSVAPSGAMRVAAVTALVVMIVVLAATRRAHLEHWLQAAARRDVILGMVAALPPECERVYIEGADNVAGAYVFRNGLPEALRRTGASEVALVATPDAALPVCRKSH
jgi:hypothetical protein